MHALQTLGAELVALPRDALPRLPMPETLADAVRDAQRITDHEGKRRQLQYIGRVMRSLSSEETAALRAWLAARRGTSQAETARLHWIERTRAQLLADDNALTAFIHQYPAANAQEGHALIRNARREAQYNKPPRHFRELFQWIKAASDATARDHTSSSPPLHDDDAS